MLGRAILSTSWKAATKAISRHLHEVKGTIQTAINLLVIHYESELGVLHVEHLVLLLFRVHHVQTRTNVCGVRTFCHELE